MRGYCTVNHKLNNLHFIKTLIKTHLNSFKREMPASNIYLAKEIH